MEKLTDQAVLAKVSFEDPESRVRRTAVEKLTDQAALAKVAVEDSDHRIRQAAIEKLADQTVLARMGMWVKPELTRQVRDQKLLAQIAAEAKDSDVRRAAEETLARERVEELRKIEAGPQPGDEVIALNDVPLESEEQTVATVRKGDKLIVERIEDTRLWVASGETKGWVDGGFVMSTALREWYRRLEDGASVTQKGQTRAKFAGIFFAISGAGQGPAVMTGSGTGRVFNQRGPFSDIAYNNIRLILAGANIPNEQVLWIRFDPPDGARQIIPPPPGWTMGSNYGAVSSGNYVFVDKARQVFVNGELRRPR